MDNNEKKEKDEIGEMTLKHPVQQAYSSNPTTDKEVRDAVIQLNPDKNGMNDNRG